ncbi:Uncharacterised protein [Serratia ficaria]|nr:Uncharacterised protein [Serratia ficaria]CAI1965685.1 Uncharacterised protein [Serratia ficaria]
MNDKIKVSELTTEALASLGDFYKFNIPKRSPLQGDGFSFFLMLLLPVL